MLRRHMTATIEEARTYRVRQAWLVDSMTNASCSFLCSLLSEFRPLLRREHRRVATCYKLLPLTRQ